MRIRWKISPAPTGQWRSFQRRGWPYALDGEGNTVAIIYCQNGTSYYPKAKESDQLALRVRVLRNKDGERAWGVLKGTFTSYQQVKDMVKKYYDQNPGFI